MPRLVLKEHQHEIEFLEVAPRSPLLRRHLRGSQAHRTQYLVAPLAMAEMTFPWTRLHMPHAAHPADLVSQTGIVTSATSQTDFRTIGAAGVTAHVKCKSQTSASAMCAYTNVATGCPNAPHVAFCFPQPRIVRLRQPQLSHLDSRIRKFATAHCGSTPDVPNRNGTLQS